MNLHAHSHAEAGNNPFRVVCAVVAVMFCALLCGCGPGNKSSKGDDSGGVASEAFTPETADLTAEAEAYADSMLRTMTLAEQIGQLFMPAVYSSTEGYTVAKVHEYASELRVGGIILLKGDVYGAACIADTFRQLAKVPALVAIDAENGLRMRLEDAPEYPWNRELGNVSDDQLMYDFGRELARECRAVGINMVLGPVIDVVPGTGSKGIMRKRSFGSDPHKVADLAVAYARGVEEGNVMTVSKHFPGHGSANADSHKRLGVIHSAAAALDSIDLYPFRRYVEEGLSGVMVGHLAAASLDTVMRPAVVSPKLMKGLLRWEMGFRGLVLTDAINMEGAMGVKAWQAIDAGADLVLAPTDTKAEIRDAMQAVAEKRLKRSVIADRCRRILFFKYLLEVGRERRIPPSGALEQVLTGASQVQDSISSALRRHRSSIR